MKAKQPQIPMKGSYLSKQIISDNKIYEDEQDELQQCLKYIKDSNDQTHHQSKVPPISELMNLRFRPEDKNIHDQILELARYSQDLENQISNKNREIERLQYMIKYLTIAQQKRDEVLSHVQDENRRLKEANVMLQNQNQNYQYMKNIQKKKHNSNSVAFLPSITTPKQFESNKNSASNKGQKMPVSPKSNQEDDINNNSIQKLGQLTSKAQINIKKNKQKLRQKENFEDKPQTILQVDLNSDVTQHYYEKEHVQLIQPLMQEEESFIQNMKDMDFLGMLSVYDAINKLYYEHGQVYQIVFRLRKLLKAAIRMSSTQAMQEALESLVENICLCLESNRASVFIFDPETETLWTKVAKGSDKTIRIPFNQGLVGHVFTKGETLNIMNAYNDQRFNKDVDKAQNYKTNTVLCIPIRDMDGNNIIGVLQAVNKMKGYFTQDDEALLTLVGQLASIVLRNSQQFDETVLYHNNLRSILKTGIILSQYFKTKDLIKNSIKELKNAFNVQKGNIIIVDRNENMFRYYDQDKDFELSMFPLDLGIAGHTYNTGETLNIVNAYNDGLFNRQIDLDTSMPLISMPVKSFNDNAIVAIVQIINGRGIQGLSSTNKAKIKSVDFEYLEFFGHQFAQILKNSYNFDNEVKLASKQLSQ